MLINLNSIEKQHTNGADQADLHEFILIQNLIVAYKH